MSIKPRRATGRVVNVEAEPAHAAKGGVISLPDSPAQIVLRWIPGLFFILTVLFVAGYLALSSTIMGFLKVDDTRAVLVRGAYPIGQVPAGEHVFISAQPPARDLPGKFGQTVRGVPSPAVVMIIGTPGDHVYSDEQGTIHVNGSATRYTGTVLERVLIEEYLGACLAGVCQAGDEVVFPQDHVIGQVTGWLGSVPAGYEAE